ncbi:uncharacterized protein N7496_011902 [Penicillium cataractarum]|uniref:Zn(2)-C6 fungal-type domain-containing protein n=1 Tax=Penicillium cataractarum TaxID=2100454 RepID=A0A9W9RHQ5_9EURO|nr:uncharacterized protein N7496_011902 [Penicillium cataractarum]KAJ5359489.1 hypothetical protein N7496_011902 [Penicillium cataractarum]
MDRRIPNPCYTCRNRRIQCDQSGVPCGKCQKAGLECLDKRPFKWVKGVAIRGKLQGHSYENATPSSAIVKDKFVGPANPKRALVQASVRRDRRFDTLVTTSGSSSSSSSPGPSLIIQDPTFSSLDKTSKYYIDYYNERICELFIVYDTERNPFRSLIPLGLENPVLMKALLALAARHHVNKGQSFHEPESPTSPQLVTANRHALAFKHQAMEALSKSLADPKISKQDTTVASIFLLVFLDLLESGSDGWNFHLEGAKNLIASTYPQNDSQAGINHGPGQTVQEIRAFITKQIKVIETLGATFLRPKLLSYFASFEQQELQLQESIESSFVGCPEYLLSVMQLLSMQRDIISELRQLGQTAMESHIKETKSLLEMTQNFDCYAWASGLQQSRTPSPSEIISLCSLSRSYKLGTSIYGRRILDAMTGEKTVLDDTVAELLGLIDSLQNDRVMFKCVLWPIFVAGLECQWQLQREFLIACAERFWDITNCLNAVNAAKILQEYWRQVDASGQSQSRWIFDIGRLGRDWLWI